MRTLLSIFLLIFSSFCGAQAKIASVKYIHDTITDVHGLAVPLEPGIIDSRVASAKYVLLQIDRANEILNETATNYASSDIALPNTIDSLKAAEYIRDLIKQTRGFGLLLENAGSFSFKITAKGTFTISWGDGSKEVMIKTDTLEDVYSHTYAAARNYRVTINGPATGYTTGYGWGNHAISFSDDCSKVRRIYGDLGEVFPILSNTVAGAPRFMKTFALCSNLSGPIPETLFAGLRGAPIEWMFAYIFYDTDFTGEIPENLFAGLQGPPAYAMMERVFQGNKNLTGQIPGNLFSGIQGSLKGWDFNGTFQNCPGLTGIGDGLFDGIETSDPLPTRAFTYAFADCPGLTGPSAKIGGQYLYDIWPDATEDNVIQIYKNTLNLSDYANIPALWK